MARGGKGGRRGGSRGRGTPVAQSGGKSTSWADTKSGAGTIGSTGGSRGQGVHGHGRTNSGTPYNIRGTSGDKSKTSQKGAVKHGAPTALSGAPHPRTSGSTSVPYPKLRKGQVRQRGGSRG